MEHNHLEHSIGILLTCPVIYAYDIPKIFMDALNNRLHFSLPRYDSVHLALHEALVNGLIHGNLQIGSSLRQSARDFAEYARLLSERLNNPAFARKSVSICATWNQDKLEIKIRDEGAGYSVAPLAPKCPVVHSKSGRGIKLIAGTADSCTIDDFGREITLNFLISDIGKPCPENPQPELDQPQALADLSSCRVLVVEDDPSTRAVLRQLLGVIDIHDVEMASDGVEGLNKVLEYRPDLIILDITMPRMDGYEVLSHLKAATETRDIPVLIQTGSDNRETREKTFSAGATDFISKPVNPLEFFARVKVHLQNRLLVRHLEAQLQQVETELQSAHRMQTNMLPTPAAIADLRASFRLDVGQHFQPSSALGGDFWQFFPISKNQVAFYICDFSGHGVAAALNTFRLHTLIAQMRRHIKSPQVFLHMLNKQLLDLLPRGQFSTFFLGVYNRRRHTLTYAGAGAPAPMLDRGHRMRSLDTRGMPLGIAAQPIYRNRTVPFKPGDALLLYSDALTEAPGLGAAAFRKMALRRWHESTAQKAVDMLMDDFFRVTPKQPLDDVTAVLIRVLK